MPCALSAPAAPGAPAAPTAAAPTAAEAAPRGAAAIDDSAAAAARRCGECNELLETPCPAVRAPAAATLRPGDASALPGDGLSPAIVNERASGRPPPLPGSPASRARRSEASDGEVTSDAAAAAVVTSEGAARARAGSPVRVRLAPLAPPAAVARRRPAADGAAAPSAPAGNGASSAAVALPGAGTDGCSCRATPAALPVETSTSASLRIRLWPPPAIRPLASPAAAAS
jgi:hypothetical protein